MKLKFKFYFFIQFFTYGIFGPYFALFLYQKQFTGVQIGLLLGSMPIATILLQPLWSYLSDVLNKHRLILILGCVGSGLSLLALGWAASFWVALVLSILNAVFRAPLSPISNAIVLDYLEVMDEREKFSLVRVWGSLGYGISSLLLGTLFLDRILEYFHWSLGCLYLLLAGLSLLLPESDQKTAYSKVKGFQFLRTNPSFLIFLLGTIFIGATQGIGMNYQSLFLQFLEASPWVFGLALSLPAFLEIPLMFMVPFFYEHISSWVMILAGAVVLPINWLLYVFIQEAGWVIPAQVFHSISTISFMVVAVAFIDQHVSQKWRATSQGLYSTAMYGIGSSFGLFLGGSVFDAFGIRAIWMMNFGLGLVGLGMLFFSLRKFKTSPEN